MDGRRPGSGTAGVGGLAALRVVVFCCWVLPAAGWDELTTLRQRASWRVKAASAGWWLVCRWVVAGQETRGGGWVQEGQERELVFGLPRGKTEKRCERGWGV